MVEFFKKIDKNTHSNVFDTTVSGFYSDLSEQGETMTVRSGMFKDLALFDFPVAHPPSYGDAKINGFKFTFEMSDTDVTNKVNYQGEHHIFMFKKGKNLGNEEGSVSRVVDSTNQVMAPAMVVFAHADDFEHDPYSIYVEDFTDTGENIISEPVAGTTVHRDFHYLSIDDAHNAYGDGIAKINYANTSFTPSKSLLRTDYGSNLPNGDDVVEVKAKDDGWESVKSAAPYGKLFWYNNSGYWNSRRNEKGVKDRVKSLEQTVADTVTDEQNAIKEITPESTFFDNIQVPKNFLKPDAQLSSSGQTDFNIRDTVFHAYAGANLSNEKYKTGGSALNLRSHVDYDGTETSATSSAAQKKFNFGSGYNRQSTCVMKRNIPAPVIFFDDVNAKGYNLTSASHSIKQEIDIDVYFDELGAAYMVNKDVHVWDSDNVYTHLRSFAIIFGENDVDDNQDFADYIASHIDKSSTIGDSDISLSAAGNVHKDLMGVIFYRVPEATTSQGNSKGIIKIKTLRGDGVNTYATNDRIFFDSATTGGENFDNPKVLGWKTHSSPVGYQLTTGKWYRLKFVYSINGGNGAQDDNDSNDDGVASMNLWIFDGDTGKLAEANLGGNASGNAYLDPIHVNNCNVDPADRINRPDAWPKNMSLWLNNIGNQHDTDTNAEADSAEDVLHTAANGEPLYTKSSVFIDKISFRNQNLRHSNVSGENNPFFASGKGVVSSPNKTLYNPALFNGQSSPHNVPPTGIAIGFNDRTQLNGTTARLLFNGFSCSQATKPSAILDANLHAGAATNALPAKMGDVADVMAQGSDLLDSLSCGASSTNVLTGDGVDNDPLQDVDGFSQKGVVKVSGITWDNDNDKRECLWASSKILKAESVEGNVATIVVDDPSILSAPVGTQFIIYKIFEDLVDYNSLDASNTSTYAIANLTKLDGNRATFAFVSNTPFNTLMRDESAAGGTYASSISSLWVSPYLFWLFIQTADDGASAARTYQSVCMIDADLSTTSGAEGLGATYNESSFSTNSGNTEYFLKRELNLIDNSSLIIDTDFGFGQHEENQGGYAARFVPKLGVNEIDLNNVADNLKLKSGERFSFAIRPKDDNVDTRMIICSSEHSTTSKRPRLYTRFIDEIPEVENFKVSPNPENPQFLDFEWQTSAKDLWYGLLHIDNKQINSQYENAIAHIPLDEESVGTSTIFLYYPDQGGRYIDREADSTRVAATVTDTDGTASTVTAEIDGLAGYNKAFDAADSELDFSTGSTLTDPGNEMTLVAHCVPNLVTSTATRNLFFRDSFLTITLQSASAGTFVQAVIQNSNDDTYTLKSPYVYTDGETPLSIIVTFDKDISANNAKLFVNGALSDSLSVDLDYGLKVNNSDIIIGNDDNNDNDAFNGRIEEIVLYNKCLEVINPQSKKFTYTKPLKNGETNKSTTAGSGSPETYCARLFLKDYHNIRGYTASEIGSSSQITIRKTSFRLADS